MSRVTRGGGAVAACVLLAGCGDDGPVAASTATTPTVATTSTDGSTGTGNPTSAGPTTTAPPSRTAKPASRRPIHRSAPTTRGRGPSATSTRTTTPAAPAASRSTSSSSSAAARCAVPAGVSASQVVLVDASGSSATIRACSRKGTGWVTSLGPYAGHVGRNGVSSSKREGDLRTPAGVFPLRGGFGAQPDPGLAIGSWSRVDAADVWVDDAGSDLYNTHQRTPAGGRWDSAEKLLNRPAYDYAQVIGYNEARTPGRGSAIFLHVDLGGGTAGCVSLPSTALRTVLRWERPGAVMAITP